MKEAIEVDLAEMISNDFGLNIAQSLERLYNSETFAQLSNQYTGLYFQSSKYVYSFLKSELLTGKMS